MTEVLDDARESRDRILAVMATVEDVLDGQSLWRAMGRYNERMRTERDPTGWDRAPSAPPLGANGGSW